MKRPGRPTAITPTVKRTLLAFMAQGGSFDDAAEGAGISHDTFRRARRANPKFEREVLRARLTFKVRCLRVIAQAIRNGDARAASWYLERVYPEEFARHRAPRWRNVEQPEPAGDGERFDWLEVVEDPAPRAARPSPAANLLKRYDVDESTPSDDDASRLSAERPHRASARSSKHGRLCIGFVPERDVNQ